MLRTRLMPLLLAAVALAAAGCGSSDKKSSAASSAAASTTAASTTAASAPAATDTAPATTTDAAPPPDPASTAPKVSNAADLQQKPKIERPSGSPPDVLVKKDLVVGTGPAAKAGDTLSMQYVGISFSNGQEFDASWDRGQPFSFPLGQGQVIAGWDQGIVGMKAGGRRELVIPPALGYGAQGQGNILPNETLVFVVDLKKIG
jgi:peptidylprolyl isomerase